MEAAWRPEGYCVPSPNRYRNQWLWDSCFHSLIWAHLDDGRAVVELRSALARQDPGTGFVPHITYWSRPEASLELWGRRGASSITQPPMYGHAVAELIRRGFDVPEELIDQARRGLASLLARRRGDEALVPILHPWESGCDDSPRWDDTPASDREQWKQERWDPEQWRRTKFELVKALRTDNGGWAIDSPRFRVHSCGFNALVAWNIIELARVGLHDAALATGAAEITEALSQRWDVERVTWVDGGTTPRRGAKVRTADALLGLLVDPRPEAVAELVDPRAYAGAFGVRGVHRDEPSYDPDRYWRGPSWPQLNYLLWRALRDQGAIEAARGVATSGLQGAIAARWSEYWNPDSGRGGGAQPQTWAGLAVLFGDAATSPSPS